MKTVFTPQSQVAHIWAQQTQAFGRSATPGQSSRFGFSSGASSASGPRVRFAGRVFFSYDTPVARLEPNRHGALVLLHRESAWGPATRGHISDAIGAVSHLVDGRAFEVPHVPGYSHSIDAIQDGRGYRDDGELLEPSAVDHVCNFAHLVEKYRAAVAGYRSKRGEIWRDYIPGHEWEAGQADDAGRYTVAETVERGLLDHWAAALDYADWFAPLHIPADFPKTRQEVQQEAAAIIAFRDERAARALAKLTPAEIARREAAKAKRAADAEKVKALRFADAAGKLAGWREGLRVESYQLPRNADGTAHIRAMGVKRDKSGQITGGRLETSQGASVPLVEAIRVFRFLKCVRDKGEGWRPQGLRTVRVGHFTVNSVEPDGSFRAGCHAFAWPEIARLAETVGVALLPCDPSAESGS